MSRPRNSVKAETPADEQTGAASAAPAAESVDEQAAAQEQTEADAQAAADEAQAEGVAPGYRVTGAAVVLRTVDGTERYLYRGAPFPAGVFTADSVERAVANSLVSETE